MSQTLNNLLTLLNLEKIEEGLFRGQSEDLGLRQVFGGQVVGQALYAAKETVPEARLVHSFHSYFLRPGDSQKPIIYDVEVLRDGNSFSARRVAAIQNGKPIFYMTASFQAPEPGFEHQNHADGSRAGRTTVRNGNRAIAGAFTAADSERKVSLRSPAGNSSRRISQSVERSRLRACASGMDSRQRHRSG